MSAYLFPDEALVQRLPLPLAQLYRRAHNAKTALERLRPNSAPGYVLRAQIATAQARAGKRSPAEIKTLYYRALADSNEAIRIYEKVRGTEEPPGAGPEQALAYLMRARCYINRGFSYLQRGEYDHALEDAATALKLDPKNSAALSLRADARRLKWWKQEGKDLIQANPRPDEVSILRFGNPRWDNYDIKMDVRKEEGRGDFGICFRATETAQLIVIFGGWKSTLHGVLAQRKEWSTMQFAVKSSPGQTELGKWYKVRIEARGSHFKVFLDGRKLFDFEASGFDRGNFALRTFGTAARFRNIKVADPKERVLFEGVPQFRQPRDPTR